MIQLASDAGNAAGLVFFLFDLLHLDGEDPDNSDAHYQRGLAFEKLGRRDEAIAATKGQARR
jgi:hypothetical protein